MKKLFILVGVAAFAFAVYAGVVQSTWTTTSDATTARNALGAAASNNLVCMNSTNLGAETVRGNALFQSNVTYVGTAQYQSNVTFQKNLVGTHWDMSEPGNFNMDGSGTVGGNFTVYGTLYASIHTIKFVEVVTNEFDEVVTNEYDGFSFDTTNNRIRGNTNFVFVGSTTFAGDVFHENLAGLQERIVKVDNAGHEGGINFSLNDGDVLSGNGTFQPMYSTNLTGNVPTNNLPGFLPQWSETDPGSFSGGGNPFTNSPTILTNIPAFDAMQTNGNTIAFLVAALGLNNGAGGEVAGITFHAWLDSTNNFLTQIFPGTGGETHSVPFSYLLSPGEIYWFSDESVEPAAASINSYVLKQFP